MRARFIAIVVLAATGASAGAQTRVVNPPPPIPQDVTVTAPKAAKVTGTYPADGAAVPGGMVVIRVSFDQSMSADGWSYSRSDRGAFPNCLSKPRLLPDKHAFVLLCSLSPNTAYAFDVNAVPAFESVAGRRPPPYPVSFKTTSDINIGLHAALDAAGLQDADDPIMNEIYTPGVVKSPPPAAGQPSGR